MFQYILKRVLIFLPTLLIISLLTFAISVFAPGDPIKEMLTSQTGDGQSANIMASEKAYQEKRQEFNLDLPIFYFSFSNQASSDTLHRIVKKPHKTNLERLIYQYGNWPEVENYYWSMRDYEQAVFNVEKDSTNAAQLIKLKDGVSELLTSYKEDKIDNKIEEIVELSTQSASLTALNSTTLKMKASYENMKAKESSWKNFIPAFHFYGTDNQYHKWFFGDKPLFGNGDGKWSSKGFVRGDFGRSYKTQRPVSSELTDAVKVTSIISLLSIFLTYLVAIPLGVFSAVKRNTVFDQISTTTLFILYSLPSFWLAIMAIVFLCGGDYLDIFPPAYKPDLSGGFFSDLKSQAYYLILPLAMWTYGSLAYLSRQMRGGVISVFSQDYIRTARSKGLSENSVIWKHTLRNSLLPIITLFASVFPAAISGSIILEMIFSIPGMGKLALEALVGRNYPIVYAVVMCSSILTLIGYLVADILYAIVDPRISYK